MSSKKVVVVVGAGLAGMKACTALEKDPGLTIKVINPQVFSHYKVGSLRGVVMGGIEQSTAAIPIDAKRFERITGVVNNVDAAAKVVTLESGETVKYDYLVVATGSTACGPATLPRDVATIQQARDFWDNQKKQIDASTKILVVGGGPVGVELAGEIRAIHPDKKITIVQKNKVLCPVSLVDMGAKFPRKLKSTLGKHNIDVKTGTVPKDLPVDEIVANHFLLPGERKVELENGESVDVDLVIWCIGNKWNTDGLPADWIAESGMVKVDEQLNVVGQTDVFAVGDVADTHDIKLGFLGGMQAVVASKNVIALNKGQPAKNKYAPKLWKVMIVPIGPNHGVARMPFGVLGSWTAKTLKGKTLFAPNYWSDCYGQKPVTRWEDRPDLEAGVGQIATN